MGLSGKFECAPHQVDVSVGVMSGELAEDGLYGRRPRQLSRR
jgi:hypothetical protein